MDIQADKGENGWDRLPGHVKQGIDESIEQANRGEFISYEEVKKEVSALLKNEDLHVYTISITRNQKFV